MGKLRNAIAKVNWGDVAVRTVKTFVATFVGLQGGARLIDWIDGTAPVDTNGLRIAAAGAVVATVTYVWNVLIQAFSPDPTPGSRAAIRFALARGGGARDMALAGASRMVVEQNDQPIAGSGPGPVIERKPRSR